MIKVGVVILNYNCSDYLFYTLDSLKRSKTDIAFSVGVIDNGSAPEDAEKARIITENYLANGFDGFFIKSENNLGFSGGNNVVMKRFMEDESITHLCLLNSDVIVTDYWLDYLTEKGYDVTGPVTNATGNEQTIAIDYEVDLDATAFDIVNAFSKYRHNAYNALDYESDILYFFNTVIDRKVVEKIGYLDERFFPGSFEDGDYCLRMKNAGFHQYVVRGCFVHHFGSGSFSKLEMPDRINISNINRKRFEEKWNTTWENDTWKRLLSFQQDLSHFANKPIDSKSSYLFGKTLESTETLIRSWAAGIEWFQSESYIDQRLAERQKVQNAEGPTKEASKGSIDNKTIIIDTPPEALSVSDILPIHFTDISELGWKRLVQLVLIKIVVRFYKLVGSPRYNELSNHSYFFPGYAYPVAPLYMISGRQMVTRLFNIFRTKARQKRTPQSNTLDDALNTDVLIELDNRLRTCEKSIVIHAPVFTKENERDGYIQRIKRIDESVFNDFLRIYVYDDGSKNDIFRIDKQGEQIYSVKYNSHNAKHREEVFRLVKTCRLQYIHSINRFMTDAINVEMCQLLVQDNVKTIWDVHGSVPEEYELYGSELGYKIGNEVELFFMQHADYIVVVNHAMQQHLIEKHGSTNAIFVTLPIFNIGASHNIGIPSEYRNNHILPSIVYCGGTQKWQNIELMCHIIEKTQGQYRYKVFVPSPEDFNSYWNGHKPSDVIVASKSPEELDEAYDDCDYGFVLRDDIVVNRVACPTKILEYIAHGIVPIFKSHNIGDFAALGLHFIDYQDLLDGKIPTFEQRTRYAQENLDILLKLENEYNNGVKELRKVVNLNL